MADLSKALQIIDDTILDSVLVRSRVSPRHREMIVLNKPEDVVQRMVNVVQPEAYIRPHRHLTPEKFEVFLPIRGSMAVFVFTDAGEISECSILRPDGPEIVADVLPPAWHTYIALEPDTAVFEAKQGPYDPATDKVFAPWAPEEDSIEAREYLSSLRNFADNVSG